jgi:hypothetical protein
MISSDVKKHWSAVLRRVEMQGRAVVVEAGGNHRRAVVIVDPEWFDRARASVGDPSGGIETGSQGGAA